MIRFLFRFAGLLLLAAAFSAAIVDATRSIAGGRILLFGLGETVSWLWPGAVAALEAKLGGGALHQAASAVLAAPTWAASGAVGILLTVLGRPAGSRPDAWR